MRTSTRTSPLLRCALWLCGALLPAAVAQPAGVVQFPTFDAEPCCQLCPQAADPASYNTKFLDSFRMLVQGSDGWLFRSQADLVTDFAPGPGDLDRLVEFQQALRERGVELVMMVQPPRGLMHADKLREVGYPYNAAAARASYERTLHALRANGIPVPDMERLLDEPGSADYFWRSDHHWTPEGTRRTAQLVAERVVQMPQYQQLPRQQFVTHREGILGRLGTLDNAAGRICGYGAPRQYLPRYVTEPVGGEGGAGLFGDESVPQVTLIGTSNSGAAYNFAGFLSEYLQTDVLNASVVGGGMDGAMLAYLPSEEFKANPPKILIWELQHFHKLGDDMFYRQAMPLMEGGCNGIDPILEREVTLKQGMTEVLFNGGGGSVLPIRGRDYILDVQYSDPRVREMRGVVWYTTGNKDSLRIEHAQRGASHEGRFVVELRSDLKWTEQVFMGLDLEVAPPEPPEPGAVAPPPPPPSTGPLRVRARLCSRNDAGKRASTPTSALAAAGVQAGH